MLKILLLASLMALGMFALTGCDGDEDGFDFNREITVVRREDGSGTHTAFIEIIGLFVDGQDLTSVDAEISPGTSIVIGSVGGNEYAIGYISLGSLNDSVSAISVNGVTPTAENVRNGSYALFRSFYLVVMEDVSPETQAFLDFVLSAEGQSIIEGRNYVPAVASAPAFDTTGDFSGTVVVSGSTSVESVMLRLAEAFRAIHGNVTVEVHAGGTGAGINATISGTADIGMSSREIRDSELEQGVRPIAIAHDGIAVIVHNDNPVDNLPGDIIRRIFGGELTRWNATE